MACRPLVRKSSKLVHTDDGTTTIKIPRNYNEHEAARNKIGVRVNEESYRTGGCEEKNPHTYDSS